MAKKPMGIIKRIQKYLNEGYEVILRKDSDGAHQVSYSRVTRIEGNSIRRTMFEALSVMETYDYEVGKYTISGIENNNRVSFFGKGKALSPKVGQFQPQDFIIEEDDDEDCDDEQDNGKVGYSISLDEYCECTAPSRNSERNGRLKRLSL